MATKYRKQVDLMKPGERDQKVLETAQHYVLDLRDQKKTWRDFYKELNDQHVFDK